MIIVGRGDSVSFRAFVSPLLDKEHEANNETGEKYDHNNCVDASVALTLSMKILAPDTYLF